MHEGKKAYEVERDMTKPAGGFEKDANAELRAKASLVADLLTIKMNDLRPWYETETRKLANTTAEVWQSKECRPGQLIVLTHVSFGEATSQPTTQEIAIRRGGEKIVLNRDKSSAIDITVDWDGQVILTEGDKVECTAYGGTSANVLTISCSGYEIKA